MALPVAAIVCIVLACWVVVVFILFGLYKFLKYRGSCDCECAPCGKSEGENECCKSLSEACNCCNPSLQGCLNSACPKKKISCVDIILCQCCAEPGQDSCLVNVLQYMFCCPCKVLTNCLMTQDENHNWVTKWTAQDQIFCQWVCPDANCGTCNDSECSCSSPTCQEMCCSKGGCNDTCSCCHAPKCQELCCAKGCCGKQDSVCCNTMWTKITNVSCLKCAKSDFEFPCKCADDKCICSKYFDSLPCCSSDNCCCFPNDKPCICSQPTSCPTYHVSVNRRMSFASQCIQCPENILCFSCNESEAIRCVCHYVCFNRCGDSNFHFSLKDRKDICTCNDSSCCSFLFELFVWFGQFLCFGGFTLCENTIKCFGYSCLGSWQLLTCRCFNPEFCSQFACLCFEFNRSASDSKDESEDEFFDTDCGCCVYKGFNTNTQGPTIEMEIPGPSEVHVPMILMSDGQKMPVPASLTDDVLRQIFQRFSSDNPDLVRSTPNVKRSNLTQRHAHRTMSLPIGRLDSRSQGSDSRSRSKLNDLEDQDSFDDQNDMEMHAGKSRSKSERWKRGSHEYDDYSSDDYDSYDERYDTENQSYRDVRRIARLRQELMEKESYYLTDETESDYEPRHGRGHSKSHRQGQKSKSKIVGASSTKSGILKAHSRYSSDQDSDYYAHEDIAAKKHAHFKHADSELYRELFPGQHTSVDSEIPEDGEAKLRSKLKKKRERLKRQDSIDATRDGIDLNTDGMVVKRKEKISTARRHQSSIDEACPSVSTRSRDHEHRSRNREHGSLKIGSQSYEHNERSEIDERRIQDNYDEQRKKRASNSGKQSERKRFSKERFENYDEEEETAFNEANSARDNHSMDEHGRSRRGKRHSRRNEREATDFDQEENMVIEDVECEEVHVPVRPHRSRDVLRRDGKPSRQSNREASGGHERSTLNEEVPARTPRSKDDLRRVQRHSRDYDREVPGFHEEPTTSKEKVPPKRPHRSKDDDKRHTKHSQRNEREALGLHEDDRVYTETRDASTHSMESSSSKKSISERMKEIRERKQQSDSDTSGSLESYDWV